MQCRERTVIFPKQTYLSSRGIHYFVTIWEAQIFYQKWNVLIAYGRDSYGSKSYFSAATGARLEAQQHPTAFKRMRNKHDNSIYEWLVI